jgi:hypothetical protein
MDRLFASFEKQLFFVVSFFLFTGCGKDSEGDMTFTWSEENKTYTNKFNENFKFSYEVSLTHSPDDKTVYYILGRSTFDHLRALSDINRSKNDLNALKFEDSEGNILYEWLVPANRPFNRKPSIDYGNLETERKKTYRIDKGKGLKISRSQLQRTTRLVPEFYVSFDDAAKHYLQSE